MLLFFTCLLVLNSALSNCHTIDDTNRLLKDKLADYNKSTRPTYNQSTPTLVTFGFELIYIENFDEVQQKLSIVAIPGLNWTDEMMIWNPSDYGGLFSLVTESGPFWIPKLVLGNGFGNRDPVGNDWQTIRFIAYGGVFYYPSEIYSSVCNVDVTYYPWDIHSCLLNFSPQGYTPDEVYVSSVGEKVGMTYYIDNGGWSLIDTRIRSVKTKHYSEMNVEIVLERKPRYVIVNVIMPIIFMAFLSNVVFLIPADCGEKISYSITVLLAIGVYLTLVGDNLPKLSKPMSYFSYYLLSMLITSMCIALATIFNLRIYHSDESNPVTGCWAKIAACGCRKKKKTRQTKSSTKEAYVNRVDQNGFVIPESIYPGTHRNNYKPGSQLQMQKVNKPLRSMRHSDNLMDTLDGNSDKKSISWKDVSVALDNIFIVIFLIILTISTTVYVVIIATSERAKLT